MCEPQAAHRVPRFKWNQALEEMSPDDTAQTSGSIRLKQVSAGYPSLQPGVSQDPGERVAFTVMYSEELQKVF